MWFIYIVLAAQAAIFGIGAATGDRSITTETGRIVCGLIAACDIIAIAVLYAR